jgi:pimeloyl-ACP methyl ester carboxylesterase
MAPLQRDVHLQDGRTLRVLEDGDPRGRPIFVLHGTPGSKLLYEDHVADAKRRGVRLIGHDRPGYGGSTPQPGRRVLDEAEDIRAIADDLGIDKFALWGHSGGGAPALACAAVLSDRLVAAASLAGVAPYPAEGLDWLDGAGELNVKDFQLMMSDRSAWELKTAEDAKEMRDATTEQIPVLLSSLLSDVDRAALTRELSAFFVSQSLDGLTPGSAGLRDDNLSAIEPWGFELSSIRVPLQLWHGKHDKFVPYSHGVWLASRLPSAEIHLDPDEGHLTLFTGAIPSVHEWLASHF